MTEDTKGHSTRHKAKEWPLKNKEIMRVTFISDTHNKHKQVTQDLPGGDLEILKSSIFNILFQYSDETTVYCGHGPETTIGQEKRTNYIHQF